MKIEEILKEELGPSGRLISMSKGRYHFNNPNNIALFNGNLCTEEEGKIWYGDIDVTEELDKLLSLSKATETYTYCMKMMPGLRMKLSP